MRRLLALGALIPVALALAALGPFVPTPLPLRLLDACAPRATDDALSTPYATIGAETRTALEARTPWRCEVPLAPDPDAELALAVGTPDPKAALQVRVTFTPLVGERRVLGSARLGPGAAGWKDERMSLAALPRVRGRLVLEVTSPAPGVSFYLGEPVVFRPEERPAHDLVLVLLDTLRGDRVGWSGYARPTTPRLDALAAEGTIFEHAYGPTSWTRPSTATLHTGLEPFDHHVQTRRDRLSPELVTIAERLRAAGYATSAFSSNPNVLPYWGFHQGFERFVDVDSSRWTDNDDVAHMMALARKELTRIHRRPFFLYLHVNQMHEPYRAPPEHLAAVGGQEAVPSDRYDGEIHFADAELGGLWDAVRSLGLDDRTLLVVVADHGEEFGDHGGVVHGRTLYEEVLHVPAFVRYPGVVPGGVRVTRRVGLSAISPLALDLLGIESGRGGRAVLAPAAAGEAEPPSVFRLELEHRLIYAVRLGPWKYIDSLEPRVESLYDLDADPGEHTNLARTRGDQRERLARILDRTLSAGRPGVHVRLSAGPEESRRLHVVLRTTGRITSVERDGLEAGDLAVLDATGTSLAIDVLAAGQQAEVEEGGKLVPHRYPDVDEVTLRLDPPGSEVELTVTAGDPPAPLTDVWLGDRHAPERLAFAGESPSLAVPMVSIEQQPAGKPPVWVYVVPPAKADGTELPADIDRRLRALGYVD